MFYQLNPKLAKFWQTPSRNKALYGGRASSKSHDAAGMAVYLAANYSLKFLCVRQFQNKISDSVYTLLADKINNSEYKMEFKILTNSIVHKRTGSEFLFYGIARNIDEIKSTEGVDICWLEEAHALTKEQWAIIEPTIRVEGSEVWIIFNPDNITDFVWQHFIVRDAPNTIKQMINFTDNPFLSATMLRVIEDARLTMTEEEFNHIYLGVPNTNNDRSVIPYKFLLAAVDAHIKLGWPDMGKNAIRRVGFDVADDGGDLNSLMYTEGNIWRHCEVWAGLEDELLKSCRHVYAFAIEHGADITFDTIGVGAACGAKFEELNNERERHGLSTLRYYGFNASSGVSNPDEVHIQLPHIEITRGEHFENAKACSWADVAKRLRNTYEAVVHGVNHDINEMISIDSSMEGLDELFLELSTPFKSQSLRGKFMVESKKDLKKRGIPSPNRADACIMANIEPDTPSKGVLDFY